MKQVKYFNEQIEKASLMRENALTEHEVYYKNHRSLKARVIQAREFSHFAKEHDRSDKLREYKEAALKFKNSIKIMSQLKKQVEITTEEFWKTVIKEFIIFKLK